MIGSRPTRRQQQQIAGIDRHAEMFDAPADRLDRGRDHVAAVGDRGRAEHNQQRRSDRRRFASVARQSVRLRARRVSSRDNPRSRGRQARLEQAQASWRRRSPSGPAEGSRRRRPSTAGTAATPRPPPIRAPRARPQASRPGIAKGMILTVATISPRRDGANRRQASRR